MVRTTTTRIVRTPFPTSGHNLSSSSAGSTINSYVMGTPNSTAFISSPAGGRRNTSVSTYIPVQPQQASGEESMSLIVQLGTTVVASSSSQIVSNTMTVAKAATGTVLANRNVNYHDQRLVNKVSQQNTSPVLHRPANSTSLSPVATAHLQIQQQLMTKPSCIVEVQTPKLESVKKEEIQPTEESNSDDENIGEEKRPTYSGQLAMSYQFALQDHNYGAPPPVSPPPSPVPQHSKVISSINGLSGGNNSATSCTTSYTYGGGLSNIRSGVIKKNAEDEEEEEEEEDDDANSVISSNPGRDVEPEGEETETAPEGEGDDEDSVTRCICDFEHDDGYMICCDKCFVWQHVDCMGIDRSNIPEEYLCECCQPRRVDKQRARTLQMRKREELLNNDSSSDTSSTSSADTDSSIINNSTLSVRKRAVAPPVGRRKSDPVNTNRKNSVTTSSALTSSHMAKQRQRRETAIHRRGTGNQTRKREPPSRVVEKRMPVRRKSKSRLSDDEKEDMNPGIAMQQLRQWIDNYEEAVTNHYSPELRARLTSAKANGTHADLKTSSIQNPGSNTTKCRVSQISSGVRILVASSLLSANCPVIEIRGKYMLSGQHKPVSFAMSTKRSRPPPPGPFLFFYRLPKDGTEVCVDARTYGNDARFVRRSCKPNAELKHCIEKGALHLYIVTLSSVEKNEEITINHYISQDLMGQNHMRFTCACGNPKECTAVTRRNGIHEPFDRERRRRGRRTVSSEDDLSNQVLTTIAANTATISTMTTAATTITAATTMPTAIATTTTTLPACTTSTMSIAPMYNQPDVSVNTNTPLRRNSSSTRSPVKNQTTPPIIEESRDKTKEPEVAEQGNEKVDKKKMTREERKMEAIMKAFERLEKAEQRRQENQAKQAQRKEHDTPRKEVPEVKKEAEKEVHQHIPLPKTPLERPRRRRKKGRRTNSANQQAPSQSKRRTRRNSIDSDATSGDEAVGGSRDLTTPSPPPPPPAPAPTLPSTPIQLSSRTTVASVNSNADMSPASRLQTAAGLLLALSNTQMSDITPSYQSSQRDDSPPLSLPPPPPPPITGSTPQIHGGVNPTLFSSVCDSGGSTSSSSQGSTPPTPLSAACLMVAAAVGPLAPGFKFPKTKKVLMNEWLNKSPDPPPTIPSPTLPSLSSPIPHSRPPDTSDSVEGYSYKSLATLVQAASRVGMSSPTHQGHSASGRVGGAPGAGSAKKRWLRQAISEECDSPNNNSCPSPNSRAGSPPCPDYVTPLKKRRLARESMSSEQSFTPPTTPTMPGDHSLPNGSPLHKEVSHFEMAANALGVACADDDDDVDGSPEDTGTPHTQDDDEEYEDVDLKGDIEHDLNVDRYEEDPSGAAFVNTRSDCSVEPVYEEDDIHSLNIKSRNQTDVLESDKLGEVDDDSEDEPVRSKDRTPVNENLESDDIDSTLKPSSAVEDVLESSGTVEECCETETVCVPKEQIGSENLKAAVSRGMFKTPLELSDECNTNFKKPADVDSGEGEMTARKDSPVNTDETSSVAPTKRKLSISEYRQRKQRTNSCSEQPPRADEGESILTTSPARIRNRSDSTSSSSSSASSDDARTNKILADSPASLATLPLFLHPDGSDDRKGTGEDVNYVRWNSAPTLVERQRENLTERLRREFGLFLSDDEEQERARKQGLGQEIMKEGKKKGPPPPPPPPPLPPPESSSAHLPNSASHVLNMYPSPQKVHTGSSSSNYPIIGPNNSSSVTYTPNFIPGASGTPRTPVLNGPTYGSVYPVTGSLKGQVYQGFSASISGKNIGTAKGGKVPLFSPGSANSTNLSATPKSYYLPSNNSNCNVPYAVPGQYPPHSTNMPQSQQVVMVAPPRGVPPPGTQSHYLSPALSQTGGHQASSTSQQQTTANPAGTFYTVASAKAYYQSSSRP